jgi:hypothetical protein
MNQRNVRRDLQPLAGEPDRFAQGKPASVHVDHLCEETLIWLAEGTNLTQPQAEWTDPFRRGFKPLTKRQRRGDLSRVGHGEVRRDLIRHDRIPPLPQRLNASRRRSVQEHSRVSVTHAWKLALRETATSGVNAEDSPSCRRD